MRIIRVSWIQCRADEVTAGVFPHSWRGQDFEIMAYSESEARKWWAELSEREKCERLGMGGAQDDGPGLF